GAIAREREPMPAFPHCLQFLVAGKIPRRFLAALLLPLAMGDKQRGEAVVNLDERINCVLPFAAPHPQALTVWRDIPGVVRASISPPFEHFTGAQAGHGFKELLEAEYYRARVLHQYTGAGVQFIGAPRHKLAAMPH